MLESQNDTFKTILLNLENVLFLYGVKTCGLTNFMLTYFKCMCFQEVDNYDTRNDVTLPGVSADGRGVTDWYQSY